MNYKEKKDSELSFISLLLKHKDLIYQWIESGGLSSLECFEDSHIPILQAIDYAFSNNVLLTKTTYLDFLRKMGKSKMEIQNQEALFLRLEMISTRVSQNDFPVLREKIQSAYLLQNSRSYIEQFAKDIKEKDPLDCVIKLVSVMKDLIGDTKQDVPIKYQDIMDIKIQWVDEVLRKAEAEKDERILTHIKEFDDTMVVGLAPGTLTLICADVANYKSTCMLNLGLNVWELGGENVLFVPLEMPKRLVMNKIASRALHISLDGIEKPWDLTGDQKEKLKNFKEEWGKDYGAQFYLMDVGDRAPVSVIRRQIEKHLDIFKPRVVVVDYIANLIPEKRSENIRNDLQIGEMLKDLRSMGKEDGITKKGFSVISGAQVGREALKRVRKSGANKTSFYSEDIRGSHEYSADADFLYVQMKDPDNTNLLNLYCVKSRYGPTSFFGGSNKAVLEVVPEFSIVRSRQTDWTIPEKNDIQEIINNGSALTFDDSQEDFMEDLDDSVLEPSYDEEKEEKEEQVEEVDLGAHLDAEERDLLKEFDDD